MLPFGASKPRRWAAQCVNLQVATESATKGAAAPYKDVTVVSFQEDPQTAFLILRQACL